MKERRAAVNEHRSTSDFLFVESVENDQLGQIASRRTPKWMADAADIARFSHDCRIDGVEADHAKAAQFASDLIQAANLPLVCGFQNLTCQSQMEVVKFAKRINAVIDWTEGTIHRHKLRTVQRYGEVSCTLGEIDERCDVLLLLGSKQEWHQGFFESYVDKSKTQVLFLLDEVKLKNPKQSLTRLLYDLLRQLNCEDDTDHTGNSSIASILANARYSVFVADTEFVETTNPETLDLLFQLVRRLNDQTHARLIMLGRGNSRGSTECQIAATGFPFATMHQDGDNIFRPHDFTSKQLLASGHCDLCISFGIVPPVIGKGTRHIAFSNGNEFAKSTGDVQFLFRDPISETSTVIRADGLPVTIESPIQDTAASTLPELLSLDVTGIASPKSSTPGRC